jgi:LysM repeat protein
MKSTAFGIGLVAVAALSLVGCGGDDAASGSSSPVVQVGATNFVTIPPEPQTSPPITTAPDAPGSVLQYDTEYVLQEGDSYPSNLYYTWKIPIDFAAWIEMNGLTFDAETQTVPDWPPVGSKIKIPAGSTVPGEPPPGQGSTGTTQPGDGGASGTQAPDTTEAPATSAPTTTASDCTPGSYTIQEGDYPGLVAKKFDVTVSALNAANQSTKYYSSFAVGIKIVIPC